MNELIRQYGPAVIKGIASGAAVGAAVDIVAMRGWIAELNTADKDWAAKLGMEIRGHDWRKALDRAAAGASIGLFAVVLPDWASALGLAGVFGWSALKGKVGG